MIGFSFSSTSPVEIGVLGTAKPQEAALVKAAVLDQEPATAGMLKEVLPVEEPSTVETKSRPLLEDAVER